MLSILLAACILPAPASSAEPAAAPAPAPIAPAAALAVAPAAPVAPAQRADDAGDAPLDEGELREVYRKGLTRADWQLRADAVNAYGFATRDLPENEGASRLVTRMLAKALEDEDLRVRSAALVSLSWGRDVETTLGALEEFIEDLRNEGEKYATRPGEENREHYNMVMRLYEDACEIVAWHPCEDAIEILEDQLVTVRPQKGLGKLPSDLVGPLSKGLLDLGTHDAVELVIRTTNVFSGSALINNEEGNNFTLAARTLHDNLSEFAAEIGHRGPPWSELYDGDWRDWFDEVEDLELLPDELPDLEEPVGPPPVEDPDAMMRPEPLKPGERDRP